MKRRARRYGKGVHEDSCSHAGNFMNRTHKADCGACGARWGPSSKRTHNKQQYAKQFLEQYDKKVSFNLSGTPDAGNMLAQVEL